MRAVVYVSDCIGVLYGTGNRRGRNVNHGRDVRNEEFSIDREFAKSGMRIARRINFKLRMKWDVAENEVMCGYETARRDLLAGDLEGEKECHEHPRRDDEEEWTLQCANEQRLLLLLIASMRRRGIEEFLIC